MLLFEELQDRGIFEGSGDDDIYVIQDKKIIKGIDFIKDSLKQIQILTKEGELPTNAQIPLVVEKWARMIPSVYYAVCNLNPQLNEQDVIDLLFASYRCVDRRHFMVPSETIIQATKKFVQELNDKISSSIVFNRYSRGEEISKDEIQLMFIQIFTNRPYIRGVGFIDFWNHLKKERKNEH